MVMISYPKEAVFRVVKQRKLLLLKTAVQQVTGNSGERDVPNRRKSNELVFYSSVTAFVLNRLTR